MAAQAIVGFPDSLWAKHPQGPPRLESAGSEAARPASQPAPLAMRWWHDNSVLPFDIRPQVAQPAGWYRFRAAPGLRALTVPATGNVQAWVNDRAVRGTRLADWLAFRVARAGEGRADGGVADRAAARLLRRRCARRTDLAGLRPGDDRGGRLVQSRVVGVLLGRRVVSPDGGTDTGASQRWRHARSRQGGVLGGGSRERPSGRHPRRAAMARGHHRSRSSPAKTASRCWCSTRSPTTTSPSRRSIAAS